VDHNLPDDCAGATAQNDNMSPYHVAYSLFPPLTCHGTTPASFKCPGKAPPNNSLIVFLLMFMLYYKIIHLFFSGSPLDMKPLSIEYTTEEKGDSFPPIWE
jgi:hypothetical protein